MTKLAPPVPNEELQRLQTQLKQAADALRAQAAASEQQVLALKGRVRTAQTELERVRNAQSGRVKELDAELQQLRAQLHSAKAPPTPAGEGGHSSAKGEGLAVAARSFRSQDKKAVSERRQHTTGTASRPSSALALAVPHASRGSSLGRGSASGHTSPAAASSSTAIVR